MIFLKNLQETSIKLIKKTSAFLSSLSFYNVFKNIQIRSNKKTNMFLSSLSFYNVFKNIQLRSNKKTSMFLSLISFYNVFKNIQEILIRSNKKTIMFLSSLIFSTIMRTSNEIIGNSLNSYILTFKKFIKAVKNKINIFINIFNNRVKLPKKLMAILSPFIRRQIKNKIVSLLINKSKYHKLHQVLADAVEWWFFIKWLLSPVLKKNAGELTEIFLKYKGYFLNKGTNSEITDRLLVELGQELKELKRSFNLKLLALKNNNLSIEENQFSIFSLKQQHIKSLNDIEDQKKKILLDDKNYIFEKWRGIATAVDLLILLCKIFRDFIQVLMDKFVRETVENFSHEFFSRVLEIYQEDAPIDYYFAQPLKGAIDNTPFTPTFLNFPHIPANKDFEYVKSIALKVIPLKIIPIFLFRTMETTLTTLTYSGIGTAIAYGAVKATSHFLYNFNPDPIVEKIFRSMTRKHHKPMKKKMGKDLVIYDPNVEKIRNKPQVDINKEFLKLPKPEEQHNPRRDAEDKFNKKYKDYKKKYNRFDDTFDKPDSSKRSGKFHFNNRNIKEIPLEDVQERVDTAKEFQDDIKRMESAYEYAKNNREDIDEKDFKKIEDAYSFFKENQESFEWLKRNNPIVDRDDPNYSDEWLDDIGAYAKIGFSKIKRDFSDAWKRTWSIHEPSGVKLPRPDKNIDIPFVDNPKDAEEYMKVLESGEIYVREPDEVFKDNPKELEKVINLAIKRADRILGELNKKRIAAGGKSQTSEEMLSDPDVDRQAEAERALEPGLYKPEE